MVSDFAHRLSATVLAEPERSGSMTLLTVGLRRSDRGGILTNIVISDPRGRLRLLRQCTQRYGARAIGRDPLSGEHGSAGPRRSGDYQRLDCRSGWSRRADRVDSVTNVGTGEVYRDVSAADGSYALTRLPAGSYDLSVPRIGFNFVRFEKKGLVVRSGEALRIDVRLEWPGGIHAPGDDITLAVRGRSPAPAGPALGRPMARPDLSGVWLGSDDPDPEEFALEPWARAITKERIANQGRDMPAGFCLPGDVVMRSPFLCKFVGRPLSWLCCGKGLPWISPDLPGWTRPSAGGRSDMDGSLDWPVGARHAGRRYDRVQRQELVAALPPYRDDAHHTALSAS